MYIYQADVLCDDCAESLINNEIKDLQKTDTGDSDDYPQGSYEPEEADSPQHCGHCQEFLENPLTTDGIEYVKEYIENAPNNPVRSFGLIFTLVVLTKSSQALISLTISTKRPTLGAPLICGVPGRGFVLLLC